MYYIYFGLFSSLFNKLVKPVFNAVYKAILKPLFKLIGQMFEAIFVPIYNKVLQPILEKVAMSLIKTFWSFIKSLLAESLYKIEVFLYKIIDGIVDIFEILIGTKNVYFQNEGKTGSMITLFINNKDFMKIFWIFVLIAVGTLIIISVIATFRVAYGDDSRGQNTINKVIKDLLKSIFTMFTGPFYALVLIFFSITLAKTTLTIFSSNLSSNNSGRMTFGSVLFALSTMEVGSGNAGSIHDYKRSRFLYNELDYSDIDQVKRYFNLEKLNTVVGIIIGIVVLLSLIKVMYTLSVRIFDILILFLCLPFFASTIPIDNGEKYKRWKDMFIGRLFISNGTFLVFLITQVLFLPWVVSLNIETGNSIANYALICILVVSTITNICKFPSLAQGLFSYESASIDAENNRFVGDSFKSMIASVKNVASSAT